MSSKNDDESGGRQQVRRSADDGKSSRPDQVAATAAREVAELTGKQTVSVTALEPIDEGWKVGIEVLDQERIPSSSDLLSLYEVEVDLDGHLLAYRRTRRYSRGSAMNGDKE